MVSATSRGSPRRLRGASAAQPSKISLLVFSCGGGASGCQFFQAVCGGEAGADIVDQNSVFAELVGQAFDQANYCGAHGIGEDQIGDGLFGGDGGEGDDASPLFLLHVGNDFAGEVDGAEEVGIEGALPVVEGGSEKSFGGRAAGVGDADIDAAEFLRDSGDEASDSGGIGDVEGFGDDFNVVLLFYFFRGGLQGLRVAGAHGDAAAFGGEGFGGGEADSLTGGGDEGDAVFQS